MKEITLRKALALKNILAKKVSETQNKVRTSNVSQENNKSSFDAKVESDVLGQLINNLISLKTLIQEANVPIYGKMAQMAELKSLVQFWRTVPTDNREYTTERVYGTQDITKIKINQVFDAAGIDKTVNDLEEQIGTLQEEVDAHNALTKIKIPFEI